MRICIPGLTTTIPLPSHLRKAVALHVVETQTLPLYKSSSIITQRLLCKTPVNPVSGIQDSGISMDTAEEFYPRESEVTLTYPSKARGEISRTIPCNEGNQTSVAELECFVSTILGSRTEKKSIWNMVTIIQPSVLKRNHVCDSCCYHTCAPSL